MKNKDANISLKHLSDLDNAGLFLSLKKGINEIFHRRFLKRKAIKINEGYKDIISVIICTLGLNSSIYETIASVLNQDIEKSRYELIIVNNSSTEFDKKHYSDLIVTNEPRLGISYARNKGASLAKGKYLLYLDDDTAADKMLLQNILCAYKKHKDFSIIGGQIKLNLPNPAPDVFIKGRESLWSGYTVPYKAFKEVKEQYEFPYGACFSIRHSVLDFLGGFSESYGRIGDNYKGGEETELCFKARLNRLKIGIEPKAFVYHNVDKRRYTKEHIKNTVFEGIYTTYRLYLDGYTPFSWNKSYIAERINILKKECDILSSKNEDLMLFYKKCELDAFLFIKDDINDF